MSSLSSRPSPSLLGVGASRTNLHRRFYPHCLDRAENEDTETPLVSRNGNKGAAHYRDAEVDYRDREKRTTPHGTSEKTVMIRTSTCHKFRANINVKKVRLDVIIPSSRVSRINSEASNSGHVGQSTISWDLCICIISILTTRHVPIQLLVERRLCPPHPKQPLHRS